MAVSNSMFDNVHKPSHYTEGRKHEPKDVIRDWGLNFNLGNAVKYLARAGRKDDIVQDLRKAQEYIQFEIDAILLERETGSRCPEAESDTGVSWGVMKITVPEGTDPEDIIKAVIKKVYGGE